MSENRYAGLAGTALGNSTLVEIGRCVASHGLLVEEAREFVQEVSRYCNSLPTSISSADGIGLLPKAFRAISPAFIDAEKDALRKALDQIATAEEFMDRLRWSCWGTGPGKHSRVSRTERRQSMGEGCVRDQVELTDADLREAAYEILVGIRYLGNVRATLQRKLAEQGKGLRRKLAKNPDS